MAEIGEYYLEYTGTIYKLTEQKGVDALNIPIFGYLEIDNKLGQTHNLFPGITSRDLEDMDKIDPFKASLLLNEYAEKLVKECEEFLGLDKEGF